VSAPPSTSPIAFIDECTNKVPVGSIPSAKRSSINACLSVMLIHPSISKSSDYLINPQQSRLVTSQNNVLNLKEVSSNDKKGCKIVKNKLTIWSRSLIIDPQVSFWATTYTIW
jgi:hypothetical protein